MALFVQEGGGGVVVTFDCSVAAAGVWLCVWQARGGLFAGFGSWCVGEGVFTNRLLFLVPGFAVRDDDEWLRFLPGTWYFVVHSTMGST